MGQVFALIGAIPPLSNKVSSAQSHHFANKQHSFCRQTAAMADVSESPPQRSNLYRIASLKAFLPLSEERPISTRGQNLPSLIHNMSSGPALTRRRSSVRYERRSSEDDVEYGLTMAWGGASEREDRRMSVASVLMTPQMRSQRLIGNSNPRYKW
jgi:hypothetical protein